MDEPEAGDWDVGEALGWAEFCCWSALVMAPLIYWIQGPSVSNDQYVVRTALVVIAATGGALLRLLARLRRRNSIELPSRTTERPMEQGAQSKAGI